MVNPHDDKLARLDPGAFEALVATHYRELGYEVERIGHGGAHFDGGIDLKLRRGTEYIVVQCKRENALQVTHNVGHELIGVMCTQGATGAIVVNAGEFTPYARESARGDRRLALVDGDEVRRWFPDLAVPAPSLAPEWIPVGDGPSARVARSRPGNEGIKLVGTLLALSALVLWQCSRPEPVRNVPVKAAKAIPAARTPTTMGARAATATNGEEAATAQADVPVIHEPTAEEFAEWKRRNAESMDILRDSTPEIELPPR
ncbi:restriction endonuclease [Luteimonas sp. A649]